MASPSDSVSQWIVQLKEGEEDAARHICERYFRDLARLAQRNMHGQISPVFDGEDVALSVLQALCQGARHGKFPSVTDRHDLWGLLMAVTRRKVVDRLRFHKRQKRGGSQPTIQFSAIHDGAQETLQLEELLIDPETPDFLAALKDECRTLLATLRGKHVREIAEAILRGNSVTEIADALGLAPASVERKVALIQKKWTTILLAHD